MAFFKNLPYFKNKKILFYKNLKINILYNFFILN